jgi:L,D-transpeptidase catalytic domain
MNHTRPRNSAAVCGDSLRVWKTPRGVVLAALILLVLIPVARSKTLGSQKPDTTPLREARAIVSIVHQRMYLLLEGRKFREFAVSTSKFGIGDEVGSYKTPKGLFRVHCKLGEGLKSGVVFKSRKPTSEIVPPNAPGRDPVVTRIIWLEGLEEGNHHAFERCIYIHGTPQEKELGHPVSFGCVRMASTDVIKVCELLPNNSKVAIIDKLDKSTLRKMRYVEDKENPSKKEKRA